MPPADAIASLLDWFRASRPVRAWSLIVTLYGDAIVPRGGSLGLGSLTKIMALFHIDAGHVRTAMSRLTADGWIERERVGRNSFYRLSPRGEAAFADATRRIYFAAERPFDGRLRLALLGPGVDDRSAVRPRLEEVGFVPLSPTTYVAVDDPPPEILKFDGVFFIVADAAEAAARIAATAWKLPAMLNAYRAFIERFAPLEAALGEGAAIAEADALLARLLLIHEFRRLVLRDPFLPAALLPSDWPAGAARALAARIYRCVVPASERFLDANARNECGRLPPPGPGFAARFSEIA